MSADGEISSSLIVLLCALSGHYGAVENVSSFDTELSAFLCQLDSLFIDVQACFWTAIAIIDSLPDYYFGCTLDAKVS